MLRSPTRAISWDRGRILFDLGGFFMDTTARSSASCDGPRHAGLNTAIESFWRCKVVEIRPFLWSIRAPWRSLRSQGRPWGVSGTSPGVPGAWPGVPGASSEVPGSQGRAWGSQGRPQGSQGRAQGIPGIPRGLWGRPGHPRNPSHKDDSGI